MRAVSQLRIRPPRKCHCAATRLKLHPDGEVVNHRPDHYRSDRRWSSRRADPTLMSRRRCRYGVSSGPAALARPATRPENRQPPRNVPSSAR